MSCLMPDTHRRRDSTVELSHVGGVNASVGSRDPIYNFLSCWAIEVGDKWRHNDVIVVKVINIDQNSCSQSAMFSFKIVDPIRRQSSWASCELCSHRRRRRRRRRRRQRDATVSSRRRRRRCVLGLTMLLLFLFFLEFLLLSDFQCTKTFSFGNLS